ncbi:MAG: hypothetical protein DRJ65_03160 [Acidobacteria bacterium]|nr:MAG: hypothetical protein DRJ65_03160 [Acidobacteriota bacterium]
MTVKMGRGEGEQGSRGEGERGVRVNVQRSTQNEDAPGRQKQGRRMAPLFDILERKSVSR